MIQRSLIADFRHVWSEDPALDKANPHFSHEEFMRTGDMKFVPAKEGEHLTIFGLAALSRKQFQRVKAINAMGDTVTSAVLALAYGLRSVQNFHLPDGSELVVNRQLDSEGEMRASEATLDALYDMALIAQLGTRIIRESTLRPKNG